MSTKTRYTLEVSAEDGRRFWMCEFPSGELQPLAPEAELRFFSSPPQTAPGGARFPIGTVVEVVVPADVHAANRREAEVVANLLRRAMRGHLAALGMHDVSDEDADRAIAAAVTEMGQTVLNAVQPVMQAGTVVDDLVRRINAADTRARDHALERMRADQRGK